MISNKSLQVLSAFAAGVVFSVGLAISGMTDPAKVRGFLDVFGGWDPSLMFVMAGALATAFAGYRLTAGRTAPILGGAFSVREFREVDGRLVGGAALFGVGWGLSGFCPGPAIAGVVSGIPSVAVFVAAMGAGMLLVDHAPRLLRVRLPEPVTEDG